MYRMNKALFKRQLARKTKCHIDNGWPCLNCFLSMSRWLTLSDWRAMLAYRGDQPGFKLTKARSRRLERIFNLVG